MTDVNSQTTPSDAVVDRLNDPAVAASLVTLLDHSELLSTLVLGLAGLMERGDLIMDAVVEGVNDLRTAQTADADEAVPTLADLTEVGRELVAATPLLSRVLASPMASAETVDLLAMVSEAANEGVANARAKSANEIRGVLSAAKVLKDPDVQRGLGTVIEISRSLGRRMQ